MARIPRILLLLISFQLLLYTSGKNIPENITVYILEGNVTVTWHPPQNNTLGWLYQVQQSEYIDLPINWTNVPQCSLVKTTTCNIGILPCNRQMQIRVGILMPENQISWSKRKIINIKNSQLSAPSFSLSSTSYSVQVRVPHKDGLSQIFPYGLQYTAYLWPEGQENQTLIISADVDEGDDGEMTFQSLQTYRVYCVRVKVESKSTEATNISSDRCIRLPLDVTLIICFAFFGFLGIIALTMVFVCFLRRPGKMPAALKPVVNGWHPMIVGLDKVEIVTDKGWLLITNKTEMKQQMSGEKSTVSEEDKERRESLDSGVSMELSHPIAPRVSKDGQIGDIQVDSGCESLKGTEATQELLSLGERSHDDGSEGREDSGFGLGTPEGSGCLDKEDIALLCVVGAGAGYRSQSPACVDVPNESTESCVMDANMALPSGGYRSRQVTCMCSDHEYCVWCKFRKPVDCQSGTLTQTNFSQSACDNDGASISNYLKKSLIQTVNVIGIEESTQSVFTQSDIKETEHSELLSSWPLLPQSEENQVFTMDTLSFTLDDVELASSGVVCMF